jgi:rod shape-determining protein MreC
VLALLVVVSLILLTAYFGESSGSPLHAVQRGVIQVLSPVQEGASRALKPVRDLFGWFGDTLHAKKERDRLKAERDELLEQAIGAQVAMEENHELHQLLTLESTSGLDRFEKVTARIVGRSPNNLLLDTLKIDVGSGEGVRIDQPVIADGGLVGRITTVTSGTSIVTLITDPSSAVPVRVLNGPQDGEKGIAKPSIGKPLDLLVQLLPREAEIDVDDPVVTSGWKSGKLESLYPPNLPVGRVTRADPEELLSDQQVHVEPIADLRHIDFVVVLIGSGGTGGERAQAP